jgi:myosin heavy subunit
LKRNRVPNSLCGLFKTQLADLMERMQKAQPHFVRCLKPNAEQAPMYWDEELVLRQLRFVDIL